MTANTKSHKIWRAYTLQSLINTVGHEHLYSGTIHECQVEGEIYRVYITPGRLQVVVQPGRRLGPLRFHYNHEEVWGTEDRFPDIETGDQDGTGSGTRTYEAK